MKLREAVSWLTGTLQRQLFPRLEECWERPLTDKERQLVSILELLQIEKFGRPGPQRFGRKPWERQAMARAFGEFARHGLGERVHEALVARYVKPALVGHISRDATAIRGREKPTARTRPPKPAPRKKGPLRRGEVRAPKPETRLERQCRQSAAAALAELPMHCDVGAHKNSKGYKQAWIGYKLHVDVNDCGLPISAVLTAASLHESQVAVPLMKMTSKRIDYLYDLMDSAYDAKPIYEVSRSLGHVPIIEKKGRRKEVIPLAPHEAVRYQERTVAERFNSRLKEGFGAGNVMVRGALKVRLHLMFGLVALFADQLLKLIS